ncbi:putative NOD3 protein [Paratrimastix pyriformis]|uniref:NOD3 protein n=1 Tax=Paratrimastix pyriformis TaxID=342808 RepID=A0ABQ8UDH9_9EUKA|nr:putative NOD3 protein [Paratrimastix pyriformis]
MAFCCCFSRRRGVRDEDDRIQDSRSPLLSDVQGPSRMTEPAPYQTSTHDQKPARVPTPPQNAGGSTCRPPSIASPISEEVPLVMTNEERRLVSWIQQFHDAEMNLDGFTFSDDGMAAIGGALRALQKPPETLNMTHTLMGYRGAAALGDCLRYDTGLKTLILNGARMGEGGAVFLAKSLRQNASLRKVRSHPPGVLPLPGGKQRPFVVPKSMFMDPPAVPLLDLRLSQIGPEAARALADALRGNAGLQVTTLHPQPVFLPVPDFTRWSEGFGETSRARTISNLYPERPRDRIFCHQCRFSGGRSGWILFSGWLFLLLSDNRIADSGALAMAEGLEANSTLRELWLDGAQITDASAGILARALAVNNALRELVLDGNQIGDEGAVAFGRLLAHNGILRNLWLCRNQIGDEGATALADGLKINTTMTQLHLHEGNRLSGRCSSALFQQDAQRIF